MKQMFFPLVLAYKRCRYEDRIGYLQITSWGYIINCKVLWKGDAALCFVARYLALTTFAVVMEWVVEPLVCILWPILAVWIVK